MPPPSLSDPHELQTTSRWTNETNNAMMFTKLSKAQRREFTRGLKPEHNTYGWSSDLDTTLLESKACIAYLAVSFPQHSVGIGSLGMVFILFSASCFYLVTFLLLFLNFFCICCMGWIWYQGVRRIYLCFFSGNSHSSLFHSSNDVIRDSLFSSNFYF